MISRRTRGQSHGIFQRRSRTRYVFEAGTTRSRSTLEGHTSWRRFHGLPFAAETSRRLYEFAEVDSTAGRQHDRAWGVAAAVVVSHGLDAQRLDRLNGSQHASGQWMTTEEGSAATIISPKGRLIVIHSDLFQDHEFLGCKILVAQCWPHHTGQERCGLHLLFGKNSSVVDGVFFACERIGAGPHPVESPINLVGREVMGALKNHMFEEVAGAPQIIRLISCAGLYEEANARREGGISDLRDDVEAVVEAFMQKLQSAPPRALGPATRPKGHREDLQPTTPQWMQC